jgi:hypothetical protein
MATPRGIKRDRERSRQDRQQEKNQRRQQRKEDRKNPSPIADGVDPDLVGIVPGPQPDPESP